MYDFYGHGINSDGKNLCVKIKEYFNRRPDTIYDKAAFNWRVQEDETVDICINSLGCSRPHTFSYKP